MPSASVAGCLLAALYLRLVTSGALRIGKGRSRLLLLARSSVSLFLFVSGQHGDQEIFGCLIFADDVPTFESVLYGFDQERYLSRLPFLQQVVICIITILLRLRECISHVMEMILDCAFGLAGRVWVEKILDSLHTVLADVFHSPVIKHAS